MSGVEVEGSVSETTPEAVPSESAPEAAPVEKAPFEPPSWIYESHQDEAPKAESKPEPAPEPQKQQWEFPTFDPDLFSISAMIAGSTVPGGIPSNSFWAK